MSLPFLRLPAGRWIFVDGLGGEVAVDVAETATVSTDIFLPHGDLCIRVRICGWLAHDFSAVNCVGSNYFTDLAIVNSLTKCSSHKIMPNLGGKTRAIFCLSFSFASTIITPLLYSLTTGKDDYKTESLVSQGENQR